MITMMMNGLVIMTKPSEGLYFWLGDQGELFDLSPEEFEKRQREWKGPRPSNYIEGLSD